MGDRPTTRSHSRLQLPARNFGGLGRGSRSPSPANPGANSVFFASPSTADSSGDAFEDAMSRTFTEDEVRQIAANAVEAALANVPRPTICSNRKPDLPAFDTKHIEVWIQRVEAAYARASIASPKDKFAFLESKIDINLNPKLNAFLFGPPTETAWMDFLKYLREEYGATRRQQANTLLNGIRRDGRRPSQFLAQVIEKTKDLTIDDIRKEVILRDLPPQVCHALASHTKNSTAEEIAKLADDYFDREGQHLHAAPAPPISNVDDVTVEADGEEDGVNAIGSRFQKGKGKSGAPTGSFTPAFGNNNPSSSGKAFSNNNVRPPSNPRRQQQRQQSTNRHDAPPLCRYHTKWGDAAIKCEPGCVHFSDHSKNPKAQAGRRA